MAAALQAVQGTGLRQGAMQLQLTARSRSQVGGVGRPWHQFLAGACFGWAGGGPPENSPGFAVASKMFRQVF